MSDDICSKFGDARSREACLKALMEAAVGGNEHAMNEITGGSAGAARTAPSTRSDAPAPTGVHEPRGTAYTDGDQRARARALITRPNTDVKATGTPTAGSVLPQGKPAKPAGETAIPQHERFTITRVDPLNVVFNLDPSARLPDDAGNAGVAKGPVVKGHSQRR